MRLLRVLASLLLLTIPSAALLAQEALLRVRAGIESLQNWYDTPTGLYQSTGWWNSANAITVLVDSMRATGDRQYTPALANTFLQAQIAIPPASQVAKRTGFPGFLNNFYDDEGWWALAWIDSYDLTRDPRYLAMAQSIFADMAGGWDATCGGGIWWSKDRKYKNAIANELFFSVAAHLATRTKARVLGHTYPQWAAMEWHWFEHSGMINADHLINDGLTIDQATGACTNNGKTTWTYNQGVILGALSENAQGRHNKAELQSARAIADAALAHLADAQGILHDACEPNCGEDGIQFKGVFMRNLSALNRSVHDARYTSFLTTNADSVWLKDRGDGDQFGLVWSGPPSSLNAGSHSSALDALVGAMAASPPASRSRQ